MEVVYEIADDALKTWVAALHCLAQIGKELCLESEGAAQLVCSVLNDAHSASAQLVCDRAFFADVRVVSTSSAAHMQMQRPRPFVRCKVFARACCNVFRTLKHVRRLEIAFVLDESAVQAAMDAIDAAGGVHATQDEWEVECDHVRWRLQCDFDVTKTHRMQVHASPIMHAVLDRATCPSHVLARQFHWTSMLAHIHHCNEVAITCAATQVKLESYAAAGEDGKTRLHTETTVEAAEFEEYVLSPDSADNDAPVQLIFCLKEVRALLSFCKSSDISQVALYFSTGGSPVMFSAESTSATKFSIEVMLSTVTTFVPAASQTQSDNELGTAHNTNQFDSPVRMNEQESDSSQSQQPRYLTHTKRQRVE